MDAGHGPGRLEDGMKAALSGDGRAKIKDVPADFEAQSHEHISHGVEHLT